MKNKIIIISPHPDDETLGAGGFLLKSKAESQKIFWLNMTNVKKDYGQSKAHVEQRFKEIQAVQKAYQIDGFFNLDLKPAGLDQYAMSEIIKRITNIFNDIKPNVVLLPNPSDVHTDHQITSKAGQACTKWYRFQSINKVLSYETLSETENNFSNVKRFNPNLFVDITNHINHKIDVMNIYSSELDNHPFPRSEKSIKALATLRGSQSGYEAAEAFEILFERQ